MIHQNNLTNSLNTQSLNQDKQNSFLKYTENVTHAKPFSHNLIQTKNSRHLTLTQRKPFKQTKRNKTIIGLQSQNTKNTNNKLTDLYIENQIIKNNHLQKQLTPQQPLKIVINQKKKSNSIDQNPKQQKGKIVSHIQSQNLNKQILSNKNQPSKTQKYRQKQQKKETPSALLKHQLQQSDLKIHIIHKKQPSEVTEQKSVSLSQIFISCSHVMKPIKHNYTINHIFNRHQSCALSQPVTFHLPTKNDQVLHSQKINRFFYSQFKIFLNKRGQQFLLGTLKSNFTGSIYNFYPQNTNQIFFSIIFSSKKTDFSKDIRYCQIYINKDLYSLQYNKVKVLPLHKMQSLEGLYVLNSQSNKLQNSIIKLKSKLPSWSQQHQCYSMDFGTKSLLPSVKNTLIVDQTEKQVMKFYKNSHLTYHMSFEYPLSWILAYGFALASTDFKIATQ